MRKLPIAAAAALVPLAYAAMASAHVEFTQTTAPPGDVALLTLQVPNERDVPTTTVSIKIPDAVGLVRFVPKPGWTRTARTQKLATPVTVGDDTVAERVASVTWSGGRIRPGELETFQLAVAMPAAAGTALTFPTVQRYADGQVVRWIGGPADEDPAPVVTASKEDTAPVRPAAGSGTGDGDGRATAALGLAVAGLAAGLGGLGLGLGRRRRTGVPSDA